jgi:hypothetical protein
MGAVWTFFVCHMSLVVTAAKQTQADREVGADVGWELTTQPSSTTRVHCLAAATAAGKGGWAGAPGGVATSCHVITQCLLICLRSPSLDGLCLPQFFLKSRLRLPSWGSILASACCCIGCTSSCDVCSCVSNEPVRRRGSHFATGPRYGVGFSHLAKGGGGFQAAHMCLLQSSRCSLLGRLVWLWVCCVGGENVCGCVDATGQSWHCVYRVIKGNCQGMTKFNFRTHRCMLASAAACACTTTKPLHVTALQIAKTVTSISQCLAARPRPELPPLALLPPPVPAAWP